MGEAVKPPMLGSTPPHDRHDRYLVAAYAADDLEPNLRIEAEQLIGSCGDCAVLLADLRSIAAATAALPLVPRTRDFRITADEAARLRPSGWRRLLEAFAGARASFSRPLAVGLTTIGLVGILATTIPGALGGSFGSAASAPDSLRNLAQPAAAGAAATAGADMVVSSPLSPYPSAAAASSGTKTGSDASAAPSASSASSAAVVVESLGSPSPAVQGGGGPGTRDPQDKGPIATNQYGASRVSTDGNVSAAAGTDTPGDGPSPLLLGSLICLVAGLGLFGARWGARRIARG